MGLTEDFDQGCLVGGDPSDRGKAADGAIQPVWEALFKDHGDNSGQQALKEVENIVDGGTYFPN